jgi:hypothetical protein
MVADHLKRQASTANRPVAVGVFYNSLDDLADREFQLWVMNRLMHRNQAVAYSITV